MRRRHFLLTGAAALPALAQTTRRTPQAGGRFELEEVAIGDLVHGMQTGRWTSHRLTELYLARIEALDRHGPRLGSVIELNPDAIAYADQLDRERKARRVRGPLHGVPVLLKDNIDSIGRMSTTAGSLALEGWHPPEDATVAARLRAAGAVILGKTNLSEWANFRSTHSVSGWSGRGGQTHNPYALDRDPSGSSSGSGVAVSANLCAAAIGTETDGSIVSPASINGIVGIKPTVGLVSRAGIIPISHSQDTAGPMTRSVRDAALLLSVLAGTDALDPATAGLSRQSGFDYTKYLDANALSGARLGIARKFFERDAPLDRFLSQCVDTLKRAGALIVDPADLPAHGKWSDPGFDLLLWEFKTDLNAYLAKLPGSWPVHTLADLIAFNDHHSDREMPFFDQEIFHMSQSKGALTEKKYREVRDECLRFTRKEGIDAVLQKHKLDAIVTLTSGPAWFIDTINGDTDTGGCSSPPAIAGYPHVTVPAGFYRDLPIGLSFFAGAWSEPTLIRLAYSFEQLTQARRKPAFSGAKPSVLN